MLVLVRERPRLSLLAATIAYLLVCGVTAIVPPTAYGPQAPAGLGDYFRDLQTLNLAMLGAQATLLGLVYPLVIALVGMLFETRSSTGHRLQIYFSETEAAPVGLIAMTYIAVVALQALFYAQLPLKVVGAMTVLNVLWFATNLAGLAFFVARSLEFVQPNRRIGLARSYIANTAWKAQLRDLILRNRWVNAAGYGYLPSEQADAGFTITPYIRDTPLIVRAFKRPRQLQDARFGLLAVALRSRANRIGLEEGGDIVLAAWPGREYSGEAVLVEGTHELTWAERWLFRWAFRFGRPPRAHVIPTTEGLLAEGVTDLVALFDAGRLDDFRARLRELIDQHGLYYQLAEAPEVGEAVPFNYAAMDNGDTLALNWVRSYIPVLDRISERLSTDHRFFQSAASLASRLQNRAGNAPPTATHALFFPTMFLVRGLLMNATRSRILGGGAIPERTFTVTGPSAVPYGRAWQDIVGGWEEFADALAPIARRKTVVRWDDLQRLSPGLTRHLRDSAMMVAMAAQSGETTAIRWSVDLMLKWDERVRRVWPTSGRGWALERDLPTLDLLGEPWEDVAKRSLRRDDAELEPVDIFDAVMENAWRDTLVVLVCSLISTSRSPSPGVFDDGAALAACALFQNREFDPGASYHPRTTPLETETIFKSILRLVGNGRAEEGGYRHAIEDLAEQIDRLEGPNYIAGRIYGWSGEATIWGHSATHGLILAASLPPAVAGRRSKVVVSSHLEGLLLPSSDESRRDLVRHLETMRSDLPGIERTHGAAIASALTATAIDIADLEERLNRIGDLIDGSLATIRAAREAALQTAPPDEVKLRALSKAAQRQAFSASGGAFPLTRFRAIGSATDDLPSMVLRLSVRRGAYVAPPMDEGVSNDEDWWAAETVGQVAQTVLLDVLAATGAAKKSPRKPETYWRALTDALEVVRAAGQTPVIIRPFRRSPTCLWDWTFGDGDRPADLSFERREDQDETYDFHLNGAAVYSSRAANGATWVLGLERLERLTFQSFGTAGLSVMDLEADPASLWRGWLRLRWGRKVELSAGPAVRLRHPEATAS